MGNSDVTNMALSRIAKAHNSCPDEYEDQLFYPGEIVGVETTFIGHREEFGGAIEHLELTVMLHRKGRDDDPVILNDKGMEVLLAHTFGAVLGVPSR